jgi:hypothetical protein
MTASSQVVAVANEAGPDGRCAVCRHQLADHDTISRRFCQATQSQAMTRNCICPAGA